MNKPLKEHYEVDTDLGMMHFINDYADDLELYNQKLEKEIIELRKLNQLQKHDLLIAFAQRVFKDVTWATQDLIERDVDDFLNNRLIKH